LLAMKKRNISIDTLVPFESRIIKRRFYPLLLLLSCALIFLSGCLALVPIVPITGKSTISVVIDNNYPPFSFLDEEGNLQGILIDRWRLWEEKTGIKVEITGMDWGKAQQEMEAGHFDVIDTIFRTEARERIYEFSEPYQDIDVPIYFNNNISGIVDANSLKGFSVAVKSNDAAIDYLQDHGVTDLVKYDSYEDIIQAAKNQNVVVFVIDKPPADYFLYLYGIEKEFNQTEPLYSGQFHRAVLKGNTSLLQTIENGFSKISDGEYRAIDQKWHGSSINPKVFLQNLQIIAIVVVIVLLLLIIWNRGLQSQVKRKTKEILENELRFRQIFETAAIGMTITNKKGEFQSCNPAIQRILGYSQIEYLKLTNKLVTHPQDANLVEKCHRELWNGQKSSYTIEKRILHKSGRYIWGRVTTSLVKDSSGQPLFSIEMFEDINDFKDTETIRDCVYRISQAMISTSNLDELFASIFQIIGRVVPVKNFYIALYDEKTDLLHFPFLIDEFEEKAESIKPGRSLSNYTMRKRAPVMVDSKKFDELLEQGEIELIGSKPIDWLGVPLIVNDKVIGVLATQSYSPDIHFYKKDAEFLEMVSNQIAQAIELKRLEEVRRISELRYRYLFEDSPVAILEKDFSELKKYLDSLKQNNVTDFQKYFKKHPEELTHCISLIRVLEVNQEALKLTHAKNKNTLLKNIDELYDTPDRSILLPQILNIAQGKTNFEWEGGLRTLDKKFIQINMHWAVAEGYEHNLEKVIVSLIDISESKKAEAALQASEERYRNLVDNLGEGIAIIDKQAVFKFTNPSANKIFGISNGTLVKQKLFNFVPKNSASFIEQQFSSSKAGETNTFELEIVRKDHENRFVQVFAQPQFDNEKDYIGALCIIHDITERKKDEEKQLLRSRFEELLTNTSTRFINVENEDIDSEINSVLKHIGQFEMVDRAYVFKIDQQSRTMSNTHEWCKDGIKPKIHEMQNLSSSTYPWFIEQITCDQLIINHVDDMPENASKEKALFKSYGIKSLANFPMWVNLELIGFVGFDSVNEDRMWDIEHSAMMQQFANIISNALERSRLLKVLEDKAIRDELTGVLNRRGFLQIANNEMARANRYHHPVGMILLDMDYLKKINDSYGHIAGDIALKEIAKFCTMNIREHDVLGRWGGDEFAILLPESNRESTVQMAARLQQCIRDHTITVQEKQIQLSISMGVAMSEKTMVTIDELFKNADTALYSAKESGRNLVKTYQSGSHTTLLL